MGNFITGILQDNRPGVTPGADHVLQLDTTRGQALSIFAPPDLCQDLEIDRAYEVVVRGTAFASPDQAPDDCLRYFAALPDGEYNGWQGRIVSMGRRFRPRLFQRVRPALFQGRWLVVATQMGRLIVRSRILRPEGVDVAVDGYLRFNGCRFDLYAVV